MVPKNVVDKIVAVILTLNDRLSLWFTIKMSYKGSHKMEDFFEYVVPPLEACGIRRAWMADYAAKETFDWTSMICQNS